MLTDEKIKEMAEREWPYAEQPFIDGYKAAREEMMKEQKEKAVRFAEWIKLQNSTSRDLRLLVEYTGALVWWYNGIVISESDLYDIFESDNGK